jgi:hypothetical protein
MYNEKQAAKTCRVLKDPRSPVNECKSSKLNSANAWAKKGDGGSK